MPTKEQLTKDLETLNSTNTHLRQEIALNNLADSEARALDKIVQALKELDYSDSRRQSRDTYGNVSEVGTVPISRVLNAAAARFGITMDYRTLIEAIGKLTEASQVHRELEEMKHERLAVEHIMYPSRVE